MRHTYVKNAFILTGTGLLLRAVGMVFRVYLAAQIGAGGMGLYQLITTVYALAVTFATAGVSVVATRIAAEYVAQNRMDEMRSAMRSVLAMSLGLGIGAAVLLYFGAPWAAVLWLHDERAVLSLRVLVPSLPFMAVSAALRGYFMAVKRIGPNARAQMLEQAVRIALVAAIIGPALQQSVAMACAAVVLGNTCSEMVSWCYMRWCYLRSTQKLGHTSTQPLGAKLAALLVPIAAGQYVTGVLRTIENLLVPLCLAMFLHSRETALEQYGALKGMAMPVLFFPFSLIATLSTLLQPDITAAYVQRRKQVLHKLASRVLLLTLMVSVLAGGLFTVLGKEIGILLYQSDEIGFYIAVLGPLMPFMYLESMVDGMLKGMDEQRASFRYMMLDNAVRIVLIWILLPRFGMQGFLFVMLVSNLLTSLLNLRRLLVVLELPFCWLEWLVKPMLAAAAAAAVSYAAAMPLAALPLIAALCLRAAVFCAAYALVVLVVYKPKAFSKA